MIKVTNEMVILIEEYIETFQEHLYHNAEELARKIIELHEANKPKPEPVAVLEHSDYQTVAAMIGDTPKKLAVRELFEGAFVVGDFLYTEPPTQEPYTGERIICAAVKDRRSNIFCGYRHNNIYKTYFDDYVGGREGVIEGFITTDKGRFVDRKESWLIADKAGQIINRGEGIDGLLFSENLY